MELGKLGDFIIPLVMLFLYFVLNAKKKKEPPKDPTAEQRRQPPPKKTTSIKQVPLPIPTRIASVESIAPPPRKKKKVQSYANRLVKGRSLREGFVLKEILNRPYK